LAEEEIRRQEAKDQADAGSPREETGMYIFFSLLRSNEKYPRSLLMFANHLFDKQNFPKNKNLFPLF
jgi:hypothetical protein